MKRLTEDYLTQIGFKIISQCSVWIDYKLGEIIVSSEMGINGGGFNIEGVGINYEHELDDVLKTKCIDGVPIDFVNEYHEIFKMSTGKNYSTK